MRFLALLFILITNFSFSQQLFGDRCTGTWKGEMYIYSKGKLVDSVTVQLNVAPINDSTWTWKTDYLSPKMPMTKDYKLVYKGQNAYVTDEGDGIQLMNYHFANKLYSIFETEGVTLTASYELIGDALVFEVTSGNKLVASNGISSITVDFLQRVVFKRIKN